VSALAIVEIGSVATGLSALDALTKRATVTIRGAGVVEPGRYILLFAGDLAEVEEAWDAAIFVAAGQLGDRELIPDVREVVLAALAGARVLGDADCVGVIEGRSIAGTVLAADRAVKDARVVLAGIRLQPGLGGRAYLVVTGLQHDVEAAVDAGRAALGERAHRTEVIARPTAQLLAALLAPGALSVGV
jgi:microcompartment protein CcmL/EutN